VERVASTVELNLGPITSKGRPLPSTQSIDAEASVNGLDYTEDPVGMAAGRMADPHKANEFVVDAASAKALGYHLGEVVPMGWLANVQTESGNFSPNQAIPSAQRARVRLV